MSAWGYYTGTAPTVQVIPNGKRLYQISVYADIGASATLKIGTLDAIEIPAGATYTLGGDDFSDDYYPGQVEIGGTPLSWTIVFGDPRTPGRGPNWCPP